MKKTVIAYVRWFDSSITYGETVTPDEVRGVLENEAAGVLVRQDKKSMSDAATVFTTFGVPFLPPNLAFIME